MSPLVDAQWTERRAHRGEARAIGVALRKRPGSGTALPSPGCPSLVEPDELSGGRAHRPPPSTVGSQHDEGVEEQGAPPPR